MQQFRFPPGDTSKSIDVFLPDSSSTTGAGLAGLVFNTASLAAYYRNTATGTVTAITLATQTVAGAWSSGGFKELDATNAKGMYRLDIPNAVLAAAGDGFIYFYGATNLVPTPVQINVGYVQSDVRQFGGTNGTFSGGRQEVNLSHWLGTAPLALSSQQVQSVIPSSTSILAVTGSVGSVTATVAANLTQILGSAITGTAAQLAAAFTKFFNVATPTGTVNSLPDASPDNIADGGLLTIRKLIRYVQLMFRKDAAIAADNATELGEINANRGSGAGAAANTSDALEALRDTQALETTSQTILGHVDAEIAAIITTLATISGLIDTEIAAIKNRTDNLPDDPADASVIAASFTTLSTAVAAVNTIATALQKLARADRKIDKTTNAAHWDEILLEEGTATELLRRELFDVDDNPLQAITTVVGQAIKPAP